MSGFLDQMAHCSAARVPSDTAGVRRAARDAAPAPALTRHGYDIIAEVKWASPSAGALATPTADQTAETAQRAQAYADAGAAAISVLTEPTHFGGGLHLMAAAAAVSSVPVMRKDFLVDPIQLFEARAFGAGGALLIVRMLSDRQLQELLAAAEEAGLWVLLEAFDEADLARIADVPPSDSILAGLNCRDLQSLKVVPERFSTGLVEAAGPHPLIAESGLLTPDDVQATARLGYCGALVGSALMRSATPAQTLARMLHTARNACSSRSVA